MERPRNISHRLKHRRGYAEPSGNAVARFALLAHDTNPRHHRALRLRRVSRRRARGLALIQEKFDCDLLARCFDLTRLRARSVGRLHRESRVARRRRRMRACFLPIGFDPRGGREIKVTWRCPNLNEVTHGSVSDRNLRRHRFARAVFVCVAGRLRSDVDARAIIR